MQELTFLNVSGRLTTEFHVVFLGGSGWAPLSLYILTVTYKHKSQSRPTQIKTYTNEKHPITLLKKEKMNDRPSSRHRGAACAVILSEWNRSTRAGPGPASARANDTSLKCAHFPKCERQASWISCRFLRGLRLRLSLTICTYLYLFKHKSQSRPTKIKTNVYNTKNILTYQFLLFFFL
jgi:hypothetical protein